MQKIRRGVIYYANLNPIIGSEQGGTRPVLVIQNDKGNQHSPTVIISAITNKKKRHLPTHIQLSECTGLAPSSTTLLEQIRTIDKRRLESFVGTLDARTIKKIDLALAVSLDLI